MDVPALVDRVRQLEIQLVAYGVIQRVLLTNWAHPYPEILQKVEDGIRRSLPANDEIDAQIAAVVFAELAAAREQIAAWPSI